jgi:hypothetical protein
MGDDSNWAEDYIQKSDKRLNDGLDNMPDGTNSAVSTSAQGKVSYDSGDMTAKDMLAQAGMETSQDYEAFRPGEDYGVSKSLNGGFTAMSASPSWEDLLNE